MAELETKDLIDKAVQKIEEIRGEVKKLEDKLNESEKIKKDLFKADEAKEAIKTQLDELLTIDWGKEKKSAVESIKSIQDHVNKLESKITEQSISGKNKVPSIESQILTFMNGNDYKSLVDMKKKRSEYKMPNDIGFEIKVISTGDVDAVGTNSIPFSLMQVEPGVAMHPNNPTLFYQLVSKGTVSKEYIQWLERNTVTRSAAMVAENGVFPESGLTWVEKSEKVKKIADSVPVTNESLEDFDYTMSEIMEVLQYNIPSIRDNQLLTGDGIGNNLLGIDTIAKTFAVPTGVNLLAAPDEVDVLTTAILQVVLGNNANDANTIGFSPSAITLNPIDFHNVKLLRNKDGNWLYPELWMPNPSVGGVPIYTSTRIAAGTAYVGDFSKARYFTRRGMSIRMWDQNGNDPVYDRVTFTCSERGVQRFKEPEKFAFVKLTFAAAKTLLTAQP